MLANGSFTMVGGQITGNQVTDSGAGVYVADKAEFYMTGGEIDGNTANYNGDGVYVVSGGQMYVSGTPEVTKNDGDGIYLAGAGTIKVAGRLQADNGASLYVTSSAGTGVKIAENATTAGQEPSMSAYDAFKTVNGTAFFRHSDNGIYIAKVTPIIYDMELHRENVPLTVGSDGEYSISYEFTGSKETITGNILGTEAELILYYVLQSADSSNTGTGAEEGLPVNAGKYNLYGSVTEINQNYTDAKVYLGTLTITPANLEPGVNIWVGFEDPEKSGSLLMQTNGAIATKIEMSYNNGNEVRPGVIVQVRSYTTGADLVPGYNSLEKLVLGEDYTLQYLNNTAVGDTGCVIITGIGNYSFTHTLYISILQNNTTYLEVTQGLFDGEAFEYGTTIPISVRPYNNYDTVQTADKDLYDIRLYVETVDGDVLLLDTSDFEFFNGTYTAMYGGYNTIDKKLDIGLNNLRVDFSPKVNGTGNMGKGESNLSIYLEKRTLSAEISQGNQRAYNGSAVYTADLDMAWQYTYWDRSTSQYVTVAYSPLLDGVTGTATGLVESPNVGSYSLYVTNVDLHGDNAKYYNLEVSAVTTKNTEVEIVAKDLALINKTFTVQVMQGVGTYVEPQITYEVEGETVVIPGTFKYTDAVYNNYNTIVETLKTMNVNDALRVTYSFTPDEMSNYTNYYGGAADGTFSGVILFQIVDISFSWDVTDPPIVIASPAIYGDPNIVYYDPSKFVANVGSEKTTTGQYYIEVTNSFGALVTDLSLLPVDDYEYIVTFTSYDNAFVKSYVTSGTFSVSKRPVALEWDSLTFLYDSTMKTPSVTITNLVWNDEVSVTVGGGGINVADYTAVLSLTGADRGNYSLDTTTLPFSIVPAAPKGVVTLDISDVNADGVVSAGDVLTADVSGISPAGGTVMYHWYRNDVLIAEATWPTYTVANGSENGSVITCLVTFSGNTAGSLTSIPVVVGNAFFTGSVNITHINGTLTATVYDANTSDYTIYWTGVTSVGTGTTYQMNTADYGNTVMVTVVADETSNYSGTFSDSIQIEAVKPYTPEITATPGNTNVTVKWETVFHGGSPLQNYSLSVTDMEGNHVTGSPFSIASTQTTYTVAGLSNNEVYYFALTAKNDVGISVSATVLSVPRDSADTETEEDVVVSTTETTYETEDGSTVTERVTVETDLVENTVTTTTTITTECADGTVIVEMLMEKTDETGVIVETANEYSLKSDTLEITYETLENATVSQGELTAKTEISDTILLPTAMLEKVTSKDDSSVTVITPNAEITFDELALTNIWATAKPKSDTTFEVIARYTSPNILPNSAQSRFGNAFVMDLIVKLDGVEVSDFGEGTATITLPFTRTDFDKAVNVYHIAVDGATEAMADAIYRNSLSSVTFTATHFSYYAVIEEENLFYDVHTSDYFYTAVMWAVDNGIASGYSGHYFSPHSISTRAQSITMLWNASGKTLTSFPTPFVDVTPDDYFYNAVSWAYMRGITNGISPRYFGVDLECTRAQIVTFLWIANNKPVVTDELYFSDVAVGSWYDDAVRWAVSEGITGGTSGTTFSPDDICTRAEIITFLYRAMGN